MAKQGYSEKAPRGGYPKPKQGDNDEVPSGLGYKPLGPDSVEADEMAAFPRKAGLPDISVAGTFTMINSYRDEEDPY